MLELVTLLNDAGIDTPGDLILVANVGEEGLGNLRGVRAAVDRFESELGGVIAIEGHNLGRVTHMAVGSHRIRVTVDGPGGHSWGAFGQPSAIHALGRIIAAISDLDVPAEPKTTYNVGVIEGGVSVNTIAPRASAIVDMRSVDKAELDNLVKQVETIVSAENTNDVQTAIEVLGERPAGKTPIDARIVQTAINVLRTIGFEAELNASSTDANIPISRGIPAICIGLTHGEGAHRVEEWIETEPISKGMLQLAMLVSEFPVD
jgi:acetylornithine deacetylase/succinyl-diaminopimelate desuccinylase-like protein